MMYKCRNCEHEVLMGVIPGATCGLLYMAQTAVAVGLLLPLLQHLFPEGLGWWWLLAAPLVLVLGFVGGLLIGLGLEFLEWVACHVNACPQCGQRKWSFGFTRGFGL